MLEVGARDAGDLGLRQRLEFGELLGHVGHIGRLVGLAAERHRRQVRAVGLDQQAVRRDESGNVTQIGSIAKS